MYWSGLLLTCSVCDVWKANRRANIALRNTRHSIVFSPFTIHELVLKYLKINDTGNKDVREGLSTINFWWTWSSFINFIYRNNTSWFWGQPLFEILSKLWCEWKFSHFSLGVQKGSILTKQNASDLFRNMVSVG